MIYCVLGGVDLIFLQNIFSVAVLICVECSPALVVFDKFLAEKSP